MVRANGCLVAAELVASSLANADSLFSQIMATEKEAHNVLDKALSCNHHSLAIAVRIALRQSAVPKELAKRLHRLAKASNVARHVSSFSLELLLRDLITHLQGDDKPSDINKPDKPADTKPASDECHMPESDECHKPADTKPLSDECFKPADTQPASDECFKPAATKPVSDECFQPADMKPESDECQPESDECHKPAATKPASDECFTPADMNPVLDQLAEISDKVERALAGVWLLLDVPHMPQHQLDQHQPAPLAVHSNFAPPQVPALAANFFAADLAADDLRDVSAQTEPDTVSTSVLADLEVQTEHSGAIFTSSDLHEVTQTHLRDLQATLMTQFKETLAVKHAEVEGLKARVDNLSLPSSRVAKQQHQQSSKPRK